MVFCSKMYTYISENVQISLQGFFLRLAYFFFGEFARFGGLSFRLLVMLSFYKAEVKHVLNLASFIILSLQILYVCCDLCICLQIFRIFKYEFLLSHFSVVN